MSTSNHHAAPRSSLIDLSIIIVSWNVCDLLRRCLQSIAAARGDLRLDVIVVDGGSIDGSPQMVAREFPDVHLIACQENVGFPKGNNMGMVHAAGRYIMLLNPDTEVIGAALSWLVTFLDNHPDVGAVGPQLLYGDGRVQSSRRRFPTLATAFFESTWLQPYAPPHLLRRYYALDLPDSETADVDWVVGAALMTRREVVGQVGEMDEGYFMYSEELDWCRRIKEAGWRVVYLPAAQIIHHEGKSSEQAVTARHIHFQRARLRYLQKFHGTVPAFCLRLFLLTSYLYQLLLEAAKGIVGHRRDLRWQRVNAYWQVLRSGLRPAGYDR